MEKRTLVWWHRMVACLSCLAFCAALFVSTAASVGAETASEDASRVASDNSGQVSDDGESDGPTPEITTLDELSGKKIGSPTGGTMDIILKSHVPDIADVFYFGTYTDMVAALQSGKIDGFITDEPVAQLLVSRNEGIALLPERVEKDNYGFAFPKNSPLTAEFNRAIEKFREDGTLDELKQRWCGADEDAKVLPAQDWDTPKGELLACVDGTNEPMGYIKDGEYVGYCNELFLLCCKELGYEAKMREMSFDAQIAAMQSGKVDLVCTSLSITEERLQSMDITTPMYEGAITVVVRSADGSGATDIFGSIAKSFERTFITEGRWKMIASGLGVTLLISVVSGTMGTALGYAAMRWRHTGSKIATGLIDLCEVLLGRLPIVVVLMVFYYVVFGAIDIPGIVVAMVVFTLSFGAGAEAVMTNAVDTVDGGQREASLALGFTESETFRGVVLPQAAARFAPLLQGNLVSLVKDTSVVGFIAVVDLTRAGDLIRSRTMEAFFPLLSVAAVYFVACTALTAATRALTKRFDQANRPRMIKGVEL